MTIEECRRLNPGKDIRPITDEAFRPYGRVITGVDTQPLIEAGLSEPMPKKGSRYVASFPAFEALPIASYITNECFGTLPTQLGYCYGHSNRLNAFEWHTGSEINVALTDLVLILARRDEIRDGKIDSCCAKIFYLQAGDMIETYATTLHFCPCEVSDKGFGLVVGLPSGTNLPLKDGFSHDPLLFASNKWLMAHVDNQALLDRGAVAGVTGENLTINIS